MKKTAFLVGNPIKKEVQKKVNKKYTIGLIALIACLVTASGAYAFGNGFVNGFQGNEEMKQALENNDYQAFVEAISQQVTEERFQQMVERNQTRQNIQQALEAGNYAAWVQAIESRPKITDLITEENFDDFAALHEARQNGDMETAQELAKELGLDQFQKGFRNRPHFGMRGRMRGTNPCGKWQEGNAEGS